MNVLASLETGLYRVVTSPAFWVVALFAVTATAIQLRGRVRLKLKRQIFDHSTFAAPYNLLMYAFSSKPTTPYLDAGEFPELKPLADQWTLLRDEGLKLFDQGHIKAAEKHNDAGFQTFFRAGWKRFYLKWYDDPLPSARGAVPSRDGAREHDSVVERRDVRAIAARRAARRAPRSGRDVAPLSPRAATTEVDAK